MDVEDERNILAELKRLCATAAARGPVVAGALQDGPKNEQMLLQQREDCILEASKLLKHASESIYLSASVTEELLEKFEAAEEGTFALAQSANSGCFSCICTDKAGRDEDVLDFTAYFIELRFEFSNVSCEMLCQREENERLLLNEHLNRTALLIDAIKTNTSNPLYLQEMAAIYKNQIQQLYLQQSFSDELTAECGKFLTQFGSIVSVINTHTEDRQLQQGIESLSGLLSSFSDAIRKELDTSLANISNAKHQFEVLRLKHISSFGKLIDVQSSHNNRLRAQQLYQSAYLSDKVEVRQLNAAQHIPFTSAHQLSVGDVMLLDDRTSLLAMDDHAV